MRRNNLEAARFIAFGELRQDRSAGHLGGACATIPFPGHLIIGSDYLRISRCYRPICHEKSVAGFETFPKFFRLYL